MKSWWVVCKVNLNTEIKMIVKSDTESKARSFAINDLYTQGYLHVNILSCNEIQHE